MRGGGAGGGGEFGAHPADEVGEMVTARRAVAAQQLGRRGAEEVGERLKPGEPRARAALFPIADRGDGNAEPAGEVGLAEPPVPGQPSPPDRQSGVEGKSVSVSVDVGGVRALKKKKK